jgi:hypothetical protein
MEDVRRLRLLVVLATCVDDEASDPSPGIDAAVDFAAAADGAAPGPGEDCPDRVTCAEGLSCFYMPLIDAFTCSSLCDTDTDCRAAGFPDGCCFVPVGGGQSTPLCMRESSGLCTAPVPTAGQRCPDGETCAEGLMCWYLTATSQCTCTALCGSFADCEAVGFKDGCCFDGSSVGQDAPPLCMPAASDLCDQGAIGD